MTTIAIGTTTIALRVVLQDEPAGYSLNTFGTALRDVSSLLTVASYLATAAEPDEYIAWREGRLLNSNFMYLHAVATAQAFRIRRLAYSSPADILLVASLGSLTITAITAAAYKAVDLWDKVNEVRQRHHAGQAEIEATKMLREQIAFARRQQAEIINSARRVERSTTHDDNVDRAVDAAAEALLRAQYLKLESDDADSSI